MHREKRRRSTSEAYGQGKYSMPLSLIERVKEATLVRGYKYPTHFVTEVLEEACDEILGERKNPNPNAKQLIEIEREIGRYSKEIAEIIFGGTSSGRKLEKWLDELDRSIQAGIIPENKREYYEKKIRNRVRKVHRLTLERSRIRDKEEKKKKHPSNKKITKEDIDRVIRNTKRR